MGRYSKRKSRRKAARNRMQYEDSFKQSIGDVGRSDRVVHESDPGTAQARITRETAQAHISGARLAVAKNLDQAPATLLAERDRRRRRTRKRILIALSVVAALFFGIIAAGAMYYMNLQNRMTVPQTYIPESLQDTPTPDPTEPFNLVIFGTDSRDPDEYDLTDTIIVARIDPVDKRIWMVSIPRDTRVELPEHGTRKINAAYAFGGPELAIWAVEEVSGIELDYFITLNFWGFEDIIDSMGGVQIDVPMAINDPRADFTPDGSASRIAAGPQLLNGAHALTFVRHRDGYIDADIGRTGAQQLFFRAIIEQLSDVPVTRLPGLANSLANNVKTNFTPMQLLQLSREMRGVSTDNFYATTLPGEWRSPFVWIDEAEAAIVWERFGVEPFEGDEEEGEESSLDPSDVTLTVRNGTTRVGIGREAASILRARGFIVEDIGNTANQAVYEENMVVYHSDRHAAELVLRFMPEGSRAVQARGMFRFETDVLVILGTEWDISQVPVADVTTPE